MVQNKVRWVAHASCIAALYVTLSSVSAMMGLASGPIQMRLSESLTVLPIYTSAAVPGLFFGCFIANVLSGCVFWDVVFGSLATLLAALVTRALKKHRYLAPIPPIFFNTLIIPFVLQYAYGAPGSIGYFFITVGIGEVLSCGVFGFILMSGLKRIENKINW